jgi:hypothetical protein
VTIACNIAAFDDSERRRYRDLAARVRAAFVARSEISEGFVFELAGGEISSLEIAEWIGMERRCCPFLSVELTASDGAGRFLTMTGPCGVKKLILSEFPLS